MSDSDSRRAATLLHLRGAAAAKGDPLAPLLVLASMYHLPGDPAGHPQYGRADNATIEELERALGHLEDAPTVAFPSGMAAITAVLASLLRAGDRLLVPSDGYYTTRELCAWFAAHFAVEVDTRPTPTLEEGGFDGYRVVFVESPSNPGLDACDLQSIARKVNASGGLLVVDNTLMTPFGQRPLELGADVVVASDTKAPNGHSDVLLGHVATRDAELLRALRAWRKLAGSIPGPFEAWLALRGLATLEVRFARMCDSAEAIAPRLAARPEVRAVRFPGSTGDPSHALAARQQARFGFVIGLTLASAAAAERFIERCALLEPATSFGGVHSTAERRARWGDAVDPGFVRLSIGCEPTAELCAALLAALE